MVENMKYSQIDNKSPALPRRRKRKLRKLCKGEGDESLDLIKEKRCRHIRNKIISILSVITFIGFCFLAHCFIADDGVHKASTIFTTMISTYRTQYSELTFDQEQEDYCNAKLDSNKLFANICQNYSILHQDEAVKKLQFAFESANRIQGIALVGPIGVGKNLVVDGIVEYFPWQENIESYSWNSYTGDEHEKYRTIGMLLDRGTSAYCGFNLLVIRKLWPNDKNIVKFVNEMTANLTRLNLKKGQGLIVLYVFNLNAMLSDYAYEKDYSSLQKLDRTVTVNFRAFNKKDLEECIHREILRENAILTKDDIDNIIETIDVKLSGCKNVNRKVLAFNRRY